MWYQFGRNSMSLLRNEDRKGQVFSYSTTKCMEFRVHILRGGVFTTQAKPCFSLSSSYSNGDVPISLKASFTLCLKGRFVLGASPVVLSDEQAVDWE